MCGALRHEGSRALAPQTEPTAGMPDSLPISTASSVLTDGKQLASISLAIVSAVISPWPRGVGGDAARLAPLDTNSALGNADLVSYLSNALQPPPEPFPAICGVTHQTSFSQAKFAGKRKSPAGRNSSHAWRRASLGKV